MEQHNLTGKLDGSLLDFIKNMYFEKMYCEMRIYLDNDMSIVFSYNPEKLYSDDDAYLLHEPQYIHLDGNVLFTDVTVYGIEDNIIRQHLIEIERINQQTTLDDYDLHEYADKILGVCAKIFNVLALQDVQIASIDAGHQDNIYEHYAR